MSQPPQNVTDVDVLVTREPIAFDVLAERGTVVVEATNVGARGPVGPTGPTGATGPQGDVGVPGPPGGQWEEVREYTVVGTTSNIPTPAGIAGGYVTVITGGAGGGSGRRGAAGTVRCGGGGGASGSALVDVWVPASAWGSTYTVVVGYGGVGGPAVTTDDTNGNAGGTQNSSSLVSGSTSIAGSGTGGGAGGTASAASGGAAWSAGFQGSAGGPSGGTGGAGGVGGWAMNQPGGGGAGGGITSGNVPSLGGAGGPARPWTNVDGGSGAVDGALPSPAGSVGKVPASGCPGGWSSITQAAAAGATPLATSYGAGGGGGGASTNGFASGKGGDGGPGYVRIRFVYNPSAAPVDNVESYVDLGNKTGAVTVDYRAGRWQKMTLTGNVTLTLSNLPTSPTVATLMLMLTQDATGNRTVTWPGGTKWPQGTAPLFSVAPGITDIVQLLVINGVVYGTVGAWGFG